ncbi:MAG TPA: hypothetical protein VIM57_06900, partial [Luteolibacter sp.]
MRDDDKFSEEAMCFSGLIQEVLLVHSAFDVLLRARCDALQAALTNMCEHSDAIQPTAEAVRKFVDDRTRA